MTNENTKNQAPNTKEASISKLQYDCIAASLGIWSLDFLWSLVFGIWCFVSSPIIELVFALNYSPVNARKPINRAVLLSGLVLSSGFLLGQGTIQFDNLVVGVVDYPISDCHGPLSGPGWSAQIWGAPLGTPEENLEPLYPTTTFRSDAPGYVLPVTLSTMLVPGNLAAVQIRVWNNEGGTIGAFTNATVRAVSPVFEVRPGGWGLPPTIPAYLEQLGDVPLFMIRSPGCELPTNQCCFAIGFSLTNIVISESQSRRISVARNKLVASAGEPGAEQTVRVAFEDITAHYSEDYLAPTGMVNFASLSSGWIQADMLDNASWS